MRMAYVSVWQHRPHAQRLPVLSVARTQMVVDADSGKVLGMHMVGDHAGEIMQVS